MLQAGGPVEGPAKTLTFILRLRALVRPVFSQPKDGVGANQQSPSSSLQAKSPERRARALNGR